MFTVHVFSGVLFIIVLYFRYVFIPSPSSSFLCLKYCLSFSSNGNDDNDDDDDEYCDDDDDDDDDGTIIMKILNKASDITRKICIFWI